MSTTNNNSANNLENINKSAEYLSSKLNIIPNGNKLITELNETLLNSTNLVEEVGKVEDKFNNISSSELETIKNELNELEVIYSEIDAYEVIIDGVIEKVNKIEEALSREELTIKNLQDPLFSSLPFIKK